MSGERLRASLADRYRIERELGAGQADGRSDGPSFATAPGGGVPHWVERIKQAVDEANR